MTKIATKPQNDHQKKKKWVKPRNWPKITKNTLKPEISKMTKNITYWPF